MEGENGKAGFFLPGVQKNDHNAITQTKGYYKWEVLAQPELTN